MAELKHANRALIATERDGQSIHLRYLELHREQRLLSNYQCQQWAVNEWLANRPASHTPEEISAALDFAGVSIWRQGLILQRLARLTEPPKVEELERTKYGTPCKCELWIEACRLAEERAEKAEAIIERLTAQEGSNP
jgi:hypothetical protein